MGGKARRRRLVTLVFSALAVVVAASAAATAGAATASANGPSTNAPAEPGGPAYPTDGGAKPVATDATVAHWSGSFDDPANGNTYGFNMVGDTDPRGAGAGATHVTVDVVPLTFSFSDGIAFDGQAAATRALRSPVFRAGSYEPSGDDNVQYADAVMRSQFDKVGTAYHLVLDVGTVFPPTRFSVPSNQGVTLVNPRGVRRGEIEDAWFSARLQELAGRLHADPQHLLLFTTDNIYLYVLDPTNCCFAGYHGASKTFGQSAGSQHGQGDQVVQTYAWATWIRPGNYDPAVKPWNTDANGLTHEIAEWADDPFVDNEVGHWRFPEPGVNACGHLIEVGDPVVHMGFHEGVDTDDAGLPYADGTYHAQDAAFLSWFARESPDVTSQPVQGGTDGRYSYLGAENPWPLMRQPAQLC
jgi:hypothetical protein